MAELLSLDEILAVDDDEPGGEILSLDEILAEDTGPSLTVKAQPQAPADGVIRIRPQERELAPTPTNPRDLLMNESDLGQSYEAGLIAAGETAERMKSGARTFGLAPDQKELIDSLLPPPDQAITESLRQEFPGSTLTGDIGATMAIPGGRTMIGGMASGAISQGLLGGDEFDIMAGGGGGGLGALVGRLFARGVSPFESPNALSKRNKKLAKELGLYEHLDVADLTGHAGRKAARAGVKSSASIAETLAPNEQIRRDILNNKMLSSIGVSGKSITAESLTKAQQKMSREFQAIAKQVKSVKKGQSFFLNNLQDIEDDAFRQLDSDSIRILQENIAIARDSILRRGNGDVLLAERRNINNLATQISASRDGNGLLADKLHQVAESIDDLMEMNAPQAVRKRLKTVRQRWANWTNLVENGVVVDESINPIKLKAVLKRKRKADYNLGRQADNPQFKLARLTEGLTDPFGSSGTAERSLGINATKAINDNTFGRIQARSILPDTQIARSLLSNQVVGQRGRDLSALTTSKAGAFITPNLESIFGGN